MRKWFSALLLLLPLLASAAIDVYQFDSEADEQRFRELIKELRCPKCQNQAISDSDADIAHDMRAQVATMIEQGRTDDEIVAYFVERYGDFVSYEPPVRLETLVLWVLPLLALALGALVVVKLVRRAGNLPLDEGDEP